MAKKRAKKAEPEQSKDEQKVQINPDKPVEQQVPLNALPTLFPNSYEIVVAAARRARQLNLGLRPLIKTEMSRPVDIALAELAAGKVSYELIGEDSGRERGTATGKTRKK